MVENSVEILQILLQNISNKSQLSIIDEIKISEKQQTLNNTFRISQVLDTAKECQ